MKIAQLKDKNRERISELARSKTLQKSVSLKIKSAENLDYRSQLNNNSENINFLIKMAKDITGATHLEDGKFLNQTTNHGRIIKLRVKSIDFYILNLQRHYKNQSING